MKKRLPIFIIILLLALYSIYYFGLTAITGLIISYDPITFNDVLEVDSLKQQYGIEDNRHPGDYGFKNFEEIAYESFDGIKLSAWYVASNNASDKCILFVHGRTSNRLKTLKYLTLIKEEGLDSIYNIFIPDLRNSGKAEPSETFMGYKFAEDVNASIIYLNDQKKQEDFVIYAFSMGAMATATMLNRNELTDKINNKNITIEKLIFDSPLVNVKATLKKGADDMGIPGFIFDKPYNSFNEMINGYADSMRFSYLLPSISIPILIFQSKDDKTTPYNIFIEEMNALNKSNLKIAEVDSVDHVEIFQSDRYQDFYQDEVAEYLKN
ncbi:MAG TPA: alpha/beta hydrolase [Cyclobacteriaceae bacterium]